ncbi:MAG: single-stranded-DNA-specific exonuclease RecJ [Gammaproteobacteria bacterium]|nr:single-stranded-DNA-specific exonuclease RecJ [Gammaproteobacteria bacterium]
MGHRWRLLYNIRPLLIVESRPKRPSELGLRLPGFLRDALAARGVAAISDLDLSLDHLHAPDLLPGVDAAADRLAAAVTGNERILIAGDFDADGATASALCVSALRAMGAGDVDFLVPNRFEYGYGLSPELVEEALKRSPQIIVTVDNGVSSVDGVALARANGVDVVVTDHHLPGEELPAAHAIVNPNLADSAFPSRNLAGVGVAFYVMGAVRRRLRAIRYFGRRAIAEPNLADWLDLVALGTVADVVPLDRNNRILVHQGLRRIRGRRTRPGVRALVEVSGRAASALSAKDLGFAIGPRLNAAGRLEDMSIGIRCLLAEDDRSARALAERLDEFNRERRDIEAGMVDEATGILDGEIGDDVAICVYQQNWHQGVIGIVAGRMRERYHRPAIVFADAGASSPGELKGSARSIPGLHIRDAIAECATRRPGLVGPFGGHAMAAGLTIRHAHLQRFRHAFNEIVAKRVSDRDLAGVIVTDGELADADMNIDNARLVAAHGPWGQGFEEPSFHGEFDIVMQRVVGERHLKLALKQNTRVVDAIAFNTEPTPGNRVRAVYRLGINDYGDADTLQLEIAALEAV